jgi:hypothetical protein
MKSFKPGMLCLITLSICVVTSAQQIITAHKEFNAKPKLFKNVPDRLPVAATKILPLISLKAGDAANISFSEKFIFKGVVTNAVTKYNGAIQTAIIKSDDYPGARFILSRIQGTDGSITYKGRIISFQHGDCFELVTENGQFILVKKNFEDMVND